MSELEPFRYVLRVRYGECDQQGVVYNPRYGEYVDLACTEFLRSALARAEIFGGTYEVQVVKLLIEWTGPARFDDVLEISVTTKSLGNTSFVLAFELCRRGETKPLATAETVNVYIEPKTWTKAPLPEAFRTRLTHGARGQLVDQSGTANAR